MNNLSEALVAVRDELIIGPLRLEVPQVASSDISAWYAGLSKTDKTLFADLHDGCLPPRSTDLIYAVEDALTELKDLKIGGVYQRTFRRGESEGEHIDPHDVVVTQTTGASAEFRLWSHSRSPIPVLLSDGDVLVFNGRIRHEVGPAKGALRVIKAVGLDYL